MNPSHIKVSCKFGAPMGRGHSNLGSGKVHLQKVRLDSGGYDKGGAYWGIGSPLYVAWDDEGGEVYARAHSRAAVKQLLSDQYTGISFYR